MKITKLAPPPPRDPHDEIVEAVLTAGVGTVVLALTEEGVYIHDALLRTGMDGWLTTNRARLSPVNSYLKESEAANWAREHLRVGRTLHLVEIA